MTVTNGPDIQQAGEVIQSMAQEAGFDVRLKVMEFASSLQSAYAGDFQTYLIGWSGRADADGNTWQLLHTGGSFNFGHYTNADVDHLLDEARLYTDVTKRRDLYSAMWQQERKDMPLIYLVDLAQHHGNESRPAGIPASAGRPDPPARRVARGRNSQPAERPKFSFSSGTLGLQVHVALSHHLAECHGSSLPGIEIAGEVIDPSGGLASPRTDTQSGAPAEQDGVKQEFRCNVCRNRSEPGFEHVAESPQRQQAPSVAGRLHMKSFPGRRSAGYRRTG